MKISVKEVLQLATAMTDVAKASRELEREKCNGIIQDEQHKLRAKVNQCCETLKAEGHTGAAIKIRDILDDRPGPETDPDSAQRFPSMFRGGPV